MKDREPHEPLEPAKQAALNSLFLNLPKGFDDRYAQLIKLRTAFHEILAIVLQAPLNDRLTERPLKTFANHEEAAAWVDTVTRELGVTTGLKETGQPVLLSAQKNTSGDPVFAYLGRRKPTERVGRLETIRTIPKLHLIPAPSDIESMFRSFRPTAKRERER